MSSPRSRTSGCRPAVGCAPCSPPGCPVRAAARRLHRAPVVDRARAPAAPARRRPARRGAEPGAAARPRAARRRDAAAGAAADAHAVGSRRGARGAADARRGADGGDWYDAFALPGGRVGLAVGDVVGHGIEPAAAAVRLRHLLRGFVLGGHDPAGVVAALDMWSRTSRTPSSARCCTRSSTSRAARSGGATAGHVPPVLIRDGRARVLASAGGTVLGVEGIVPWPQRSVGAAGRRPAGAVHGRTGRAAGRAARPGNPGRVRALRGGCGRPEDLCDALLEARPRPQRDDAAILAASIL